MNLESGGAGASGFSGASTGGPSGAGAGGTPRELNDELIMQRFSLTPRQSSAFTDKLADRFTEMRQTVIVASSLRGDALRVTDIFAASGEGESVAASPRSAGYLTDRATSPSVASVASQRSVSSQISMSGRR